MSLRGPGLTVSHQLHAQKRQRDADTLTRVTVSKLHSLWDGTTVIRRRFVRINSAEVSRTADSALCVSKRYVVSFTLIDSE